MPLSSLFWLNASVFERSHQKMRLRGLARLCRTETDRRHDRRHAHWSPRPGSAPSCVTKRIQTAVSRSGRCRRRLARLTCRRGRPRHPGSCITHPKTSPLCGRTASIVCQYSPRPRSLPRLSQAQCLRMMAQVHFGGVRNPQHQRSRFNLLVCLLRVSAASVRELVTSSSSEPPVQGPRLFPGLHLGWQRGRSMLGHTSCHFHGSCCATNTRCRLLAPKVLWARCSGSRMSCVFISLFYQFVNCV